MSNLTVEGKLKQRSVTAIITRADGTVVDLGEIAYWHRNPLKRLWWKVRHPLREIGRIKGKFTRMMENRNV